MYGANYEIDKEIVEAFIEAGLDTNALAKEDPELFEKIKPQIPEPKSEFPFSQIYEECINTKSGAGDLECFKRMEQEVKNGEDIAKVWDEKCGKLIAFYIMLVNQGTSFKMKDTKVFEYLTSQPKWSKYMHDSNNGGS